MNYLTRAFKGNIMIRKKFKQGDFVVLKTSWIIIYKLVKVTRDGLYALCINFLGEEKEIPVYNLEKYCFITK